MEASCKREMVVAAGFRVPLIRRSVHLFFASGTPGKPQIPNSQRAQLGDVRGGEGGSSEEGTMKKESVVVGAGNLAGRPLSSVFERRTAILLRIPDRRGSG